VGLQVGGQKTKVMEMTQELIDFFNNLTKNQINKVGYIFLPDINGFKVFEVSEVRLKQYLIYERMYQKSINTEVEIKRKQEICEHQFNISSWRGISRFVCSKCGFSKR